MHLIEVGRADGALATVVHIPELDAISGDAVYSNIHMWVVELSTPAGRQTWLTTIDKIAAMNPTTISARHKDPDAPDDNAARQLAQSRAYIEAFDQAVARSSSARDVIAEMTSTFPDYGNPYTLFLSAHSPVLDLPWCAHRNR